MTVELHHQSWLIDPPKDFRAQNKNLRLGDDSSVEKISTLASTRLDTNQLTALSKTIKLLNESEADLSVLSSFQLGIVGQSTTNLFADALPAAAARYGINLSTVEADYDQLMQSALDPSSLINTSNLDAILICLDHRELPFSSGPVTVCEMIAQVRNGFARGCNTPVIFQTLSCPPKPILGSFDRVNGLSMSRAIRAVNDYIVEIASVNNDYILDIETIASSIGTQLWHNPTQWNLYKLSYSMQMIPIHVDAIGRLLGAIRGRSKKCLVLDLDNTVWGGVIGDDGLNGIELGQGDPNGEAFLDVQRMALKLREHGIILAVCSKNDETNARLPFREHPDMILKEEHISVFVANWIDKATNLKTIAKALNILPSALVFVDDNPVERAQVRRALPEVAVPELPADVSDYTTTIQNAGYFEAVTFSEDDRQRAEQYSLNFRREELKSQIGNLDDFLDSLDMELYVDGFSDLSIPRVTQLTNKTNQFNVTTRCYTQAEIEAMSADPDVITIQSRLTDKFGDNGIISVLIGRVDGNVCDIDTWLMSCRVIGRRVEETLCNELVEAARSRGIEALIGKYIPTPKNNMVSKLFEKLGFEMTKEGVDGTTEWKLSLANYKPLKSAIKISRISE